MKRQSKSSRPRKRSRQKRRPNPKQDQSGNGPNRSPPIDKQRLNKLPEGVGALDSRPVEATDNHLVGWSIAGGVVAVLAALYYLLLSST